MSRRFSRFVAAALLAVSGLSMLTTAFDAEARRAGGGFSLGRQSSNVMQQRRAITPPAAAASTAAAQRSASAAGASAARSGMSKWLGPLAGIAAGLGIAALLSHLGLGGAFLEMLSSMVLIGLFVFAVLYLVRRLRGGTARPAMQAVGGENVNRQANHSSAQQPMWRESLQPAAPAGAVPTSMSAEPAPMREGDWMIPAGFDTAAFLGEAKKQFVQIQKVWDSGDLTPLREYLTQDLIAEMQQQLLSQRADTQQTEVVLLNAELLGIEKTADGHLASVRFSGMLREGAGEAFRFEEVWNLLKPAAGGWLLAGIQQIPVEHAS